MNRQIKFRGIELESGNWVYGCLLTFEPIPEIQETDFDEGAYDYQRWEVKPESVGQFTGLEDKNGVDIYEGDIIKTERNTAVVSFGNKEYVIKIYNDSDMIEINGWLVTNKNGHSETLDSSFCEGEVIGNIHSNPELIK